MTRILQITDHMGLGGIQAFIMNVYRHINRDKIQFDFLLHHKNAVTYDDEIEKLGGKIYYLPSRRDGILKNRKALNEFFRMHPEYQIVHMHQSSLSYIEPLIAAKNNGIKIRIIHSHSSSAPGSPIHKIIHSINRKRIAKIATHYFSCGILASEWMYKGSGIEDKVEIVANGIDLHEYTYNEDVRRTIRKELGIKDQQLVIGHIGRFNTVKNHKFLIECFSVFHKLNPSSLLIMAGTGPLLEDMNNLAFELGICDAVRFLGFRSDVAQLLSAMDVFVLPSLYEGFPVSAVEAQASGLPLIMSSSISNEVVVKENVIQIPLESGVKTWAKAIYSISLRRLEDNQILFEKGYDISNTVKYLSNLYDC